MQPILYGKKDEQVGTVATAWSNRKIEATISAAVEEQQAATNEIARNVQQAANSTQVVSDNIVHIAETTEKTSHSTSSMLDSTRELGVQSNNLSDAVDSFIERIKAS